MRVDIRPASIEDIPATRELLAIIWHDTYGRLFGTEKVNEIIAQWHSEEVLAAQIARNANVFLNAFDGNRLVGTLSAEFDLQGQVKLQRLYVHPDVQKRGIGRKLFLAGMAAFENQEWVYVEVARANRRAIVFYEKLGFQISDDGDGNHVVGELPAVLMRLKRL